MNDIPISEMNFERLYHFLDSKLFKEVMYKYDVWEENAEPQFFP